MKNIFLLVLTLVVMCTTGRAQSISVSWPTQGEVIASIANGGKFCTFTTTKDYAQVTIQLKNDNPMYTTYDLPVRMCDQISAGTEYTITITTPGEKTYQLFNGDSYTMVVKGFVNYWDVMPDNYDTIVEIPITGNGTEHAKLSSVKLLHMSPGGTPTAPGKLAMNGGKVTLEFDGAVQSVTGVNARGLEGSTTYHATAVEGSEGKKWEFTFDDLSNLASGETETPIFNLAITATAADGVVVFDETKDDFRLEAAWVLYTQMPTKDLGEPLFSIANLAVIDPSSTTTMTVSFPDAIGYDGCSFKVSGTLWDQNFNGTNVATKEKTPFGTTPAEITFATAAKMSYSLAITDIIIYDASDAETEHLNNLPYNINFTTTDKTTNSLNAILLTEGSNVIDTVMTGSPARWYKAVAKSNKRTKISFTGYPVMTAYLGADLTQSLGFSNPIDYINTGDEQEIYICMQNTNGQTLTATVSYQDPVADLTSFGALNFSIEKNDDVEQGSAITVSFPSHEGGRDNDAVTLNYYIFNVKGGNPDGAPVNLNGNTVATGTLGSGVPVTIDGLQIGKKYRLTVQSLHSGNHYAPGMDEQIITNQYIDFYYTEATGVTPITIGADKDALRFNLAGQRAIATSKGIIIQNGKKYIVR